MKLLIITQKVDINDDVLGFFHGWIAEFAKHCEKVTVVCLYEGKHSLTSNVKIFSLRKELHVTRSPRASKASLRGYTLREKLFVRIKYLSNFYRLIIAERSNYGHVFVHMNPIYAILGWPLWKLWGKKISLWYTHKTIDLKLRLAEKLVDKIFTASKSSFRIASTKVNIMGHGIDVQKFKIQNSKFKIDSDYFKIITVGRISPVKDYITLIEAAGILSKENVNFQIEIIGGPGTPEQYGYYGHLQDVVRYKQLDKMIYFLGKVSNKDITGYLQNAHIFVNMSHTGSLDKAALEAMACELPVLSCNEAIIDDILADYKEKLYFEKSNPRMLAEKIMALMDMNFEERQALGKELREIVVKEHNLSNLIAKICRSLT